MAETKGVAVVEQKKAQIFISHATADDALVKRLRIQLEALGLPVWVDSRNLRGGDKLTEEIEQVIRSARQIINGVRLDRKEHLDYNGEISQRKIVVRIF
jgi:hypothetical protein